MMASQTKNNNILDVIQKYHKEEMLLDELLRDKDLPENNLEHSVKPEFLVNITLDDAIKRNQELLKDFELTKARLRSRAIFCPTEIQWDEICHRYQQSPSLPVTTWRCHLPVFV